MSEEKDFGMTGEEIFIELAKDIKANPDSTSLAITFTHTQMLYIHARALACHCECLGMNAENCFASCAGKTPPYGDDNYLATMQKWGLIDEKGKPII